MIDLFLSSFTHIPQMIGGKTNYRIDCPYCLAGIDQLRASVYGTKNTYSFHCFSCNTTKTLEELLIDSEIVAEKTVITKKKQAKPIIDTNNWRTVADSLLFTYKSHPQKNELWLQYKNVNQFMIQKYDLGVGYLPNQNTLRLIVPIKDREKTVSFRGRSINNETPKWIAPKGFPASEYPLQVYGNLQKGKPVIITENPIDAMLIASHTPYSAIPSFSTSYWFSHWTEQLVTANPKIYILYDADLAGNGCVNEEHLYLSVRNRIAKNPSFQDNELITDLSLADISSNTMYFVFNYKGESQKVSIPVPAGVKLKNKLNDIGLDVHLLNWPENQPNYDIGLLWEKFTNGTINSAV